MKANEVKYLIDNVLKPKMPKNHKREIAKWFDNYIVKGDDGQDQFSEKAKNTIDWIGFLIGQYKIDTDFHQIYFKDKHIGNNTFIDFISEARKHMKLAEKLIDYLEDIRAQNELSIEQTSNSDFITFTPTDKNLFIHEGTHNGFALDPSDPSQSTPHKNLNKTRVLCDALTAKQIPATVHVDQSGRYKYPYNIVEIHHGDMSAHIYMTDFDRLGTYINRDPSPLDPLHPRKRGDLFEDDMVWTANYEGDDIWTQRIITNLETPVQELETELKKHMFWAGQHDNALLTVFCHMLKYGMIPKSQDKHTIDVGPLAEQSTYSRLYNAINRCAASYNP